MGFIPLIKSYYYLLKERSDNKMKKLYMNDDFYRKISSLLTIAKKSVVQSINKMIVVTYYEIGRIIVEEEQQGSAKAEYGRNLISALSTRLTSEFGRGYSVTNLKQMRSFYLTHSKGQTVSDDFSLTWLHYLIILCKKKNDTLVEITLPENNEQIFASKYMTVLPSKKELKELINNKSEGY